MNSHLYHLQLNIDFNNKSFYKDLFEFLGWSEIFETEDLMGYKSGTYGDIWFVNAENQVVQDYDARGLNHLAIRTDKQEDIDALMQFLNVNNVKTLFDTPKHRSEFANSAAETYYQVMFKSADNILFEVVYIGSK